MIGYKDYQNFLDVFVNLLSHYYRNKLLSVVVYGSVARNKARENSDIDILIILEKAQAEYYKRTEEIIKILKKLRHTNEYNLLRKKGYSAYIKPIIFSKQETKANKYLFLDIIEDGIILYDQNQFFKKRLLSFKKRLKELGAKRFYLNNGSWYWILKPDLKPGEIFEL